VAKEEKKWRLIPSLKEAAKQGAGSRCIQQAFGERHWLVTERMKEPKMARIEEHTPHSAPHP
jgi:hypothetical protein